MKSGQSSEAVEKWISETGFPLEMKVARELETNGFSTGQSFTYPATDEDSAPRETDVVSRATFSGGPNFSISLTLIVECVHIPLGLPWVMFIQHHADRTPARGGGYRPDHRLFLDRVGTPGAQGFIQHGYNEDLANKLTLFQLPRHIGYKVIQMDPSSVVEPEQELARAGTGKGKKPRNYCHEKMLQVYAAAAARLRAAGGTGLATGHELVFPIIVVEGETFICELDDSGKPKVTRSSGRLAVSTRSLETLLPSTNLVEIVEWDAFPSYVKDLRQAYSQFSSFVGAHGSEYSRTAAQNAMKLYTA